LPPSRLGSDGANGNKIIWDEIISILAKITQVSDVTHGPLVYLKIDVLETNMYIPGKYMLHLSLEDRFTNGLKCNKIGCKIFTYSMIRRFEYNSIQDLFDFFFMEITIIFTLCKIKGNKRN
jgi:hypothetical protein